MRKLIGAAHLSLDGVMQGPGGAQEDTSDGFDLGGWSMKYADEKAAPAIFSLVGTLARPNDLLLGRKTYDIFAGYWPQVKDETGAGINRAKKYVVSHRPVNLDWKTTVPINGDVAGKIKQLKNEDGPEIQVHGSGNLIQTLLKNDLVDEFWLKTFPVALGSGKRLFAEGAMPAGFTLKESRTSPTGVIVSSYAPAGDVKIGSFELTPSGQEATRD